MFYRPLLCHRLFFAILPPLPLARQIVQSAAWFGPDLRLLLPEHLHVTIDILDDYAAFPREAVESLRAAGGSVAADPFPIVLDRAVGSSNSVALRSRRVNGPLEALQRAVAGARACVGLEQRQGYRFSPHLTLGYRGGQPFSREIAPVAWTVAEMVLVHSLVGRTRHETLGRWPLCGAESSQYRLF